MRSLRAELLRLCSHRAAGLASEILSKTGRGMRRLSFHRYTEARVSSIQLPIPSDVEAVGPGYGNAEQASAGKRIEIPISYVQLCRHERQFHSCFRHVLPFRAGQRHLVQHLATRAVLPRIPCARQTEATRRSAPYTDTSRRIQLAELTLESIASRPDLVMLSSVMGVTLRCSALAWCACIVSTDSRATTRRLRCFLPVGVLLRIASLE